jgi:hypothetical protein
MFAAAKPFDETVRDHVKLPEGEFFVKSVARNQRGAICLCRGVGYG